MQPYTRSKILAPITLLALLLLAIATGCNGQDAAGFSDNAPEREPNTGVGQSGAQDFGRFRSIVNAGEVPAPNTLDVVGFFNEHKFELPPPECGENVCAHGMFGVWGNMINGANCTLAMMAFNTPLDPDDFERPPLNMAFAVDVSGSMEGAPLEAVRAGLIELAKTLHPKDEVALITYSTEAQLVIESSPETDPDRALLIEAINALEARGGTNIYDGLRAALEHVKGNLDEERQNRVIFLSDGVASAGLTNTERIINLGETYAEQGVGITSIGVGADFDIELMRSLSEVGAGNYYFIEDLASVEEIFTVEAETFLIPVAQDVTIEFDVAKGYRFRAAYGTRTWEGDADGATIKIPGLFMASRQSVDDIDVGGGRRGGGGAILFEVVPTSNQSELRDVQPGAPIGQITMTYRQPGTETMVTTESTITNQLAPGDTPEEGAFDNVMVEKAFVALNIFAGLKLATERYSGGAPNQALDILVPLRKGVGEWLEENDDIDIQYDYELLDTLIRTLEKEGWQITPTPPQSPWPHD